MTSINSVRDPKTGRFQTTTNAARYKMVQFNNRRMSAQSREICISLNIPFIPKGFVVHHIDENKKNNELDNLALMTITGHNRIHAHEPWNKGLTKDGEEWTNYVMGSREEKDKIYLEKFKETYELYLSGKSYKEIAEIMGVKHRTIPFRINRYKEIIKKYE